MSFPTLPDSSINRIFSEMVLTYGSDWMMKWEGLDIDALRKQWAKDLGGFVNRLDAIEFALEHLPVDRPPNSLQFRVICMAAPAPDVPVQPQLPAMPPQKADISRLKAELGRLKTLQAETAKTPRAWAKRLRDQRNLSHAQQQMVQTALSTDDPRNSHKPQIGDFNPIPPEALPPAMRKKAR